MGSMSTATVLSSMAAGIASASPNGTAWKPGVYGPKPRGAASSSAKLMIVGVRREPTARRLIVGEADDRGGTSVEVVARHHDIARSGGDTLDVGAPLAGHLDAALDGVRAAVHRQHHVLAAQL